MQAKQMAMTDERGGRGMSWQALERYPKVSN